MSQCYTIELPTFFAKIDIKCMYTKWRGNFFVGIAPPPFFFKFSSKVSDQNNASHSTTSLFFLENGRVVTHVRTNNDFHKRRFLTPIRLQVASAHYPIEKVATFLSNTC